MSEVATIGLDIAKRVFLAHGADSTGRAVFSRKLTRGKLLDFFAAHPRCLVALEASGGAHHWARELRAMGHEVRLIPPAYVGPSSSATRTMLLMRRRLRGGTAAEHAFCCGEERGAAGSGAGVPHARSCCEAAYPVRQCNPRALAEYGWVEPRGAFHLTKLADLLEDGEIGETLPEAARPMFAMMVDMLGDLDRRIAVSDKEITRRAREDEVARRLMTIPGIGPITATASRHRTTSGNVRKGARLCCLARAGTEAGVDRWQAEAWRDHADG